MLPIALPKDQVELLMTDAEAKKKVTVDLPEQKVIREGGEAFPFAVDAFRKHCLLNGLDDIGLTLQKGALIDAFEEKRSASFPWLDGVKRGDVATVQVSGSKGSNFYTRTAKGFLTGLPATEARPARAPAEKLLITATGSAIERAVRVANDLQDAGDADIVKVQTRLIAAIGDKSGTPAVPQVIIDMKAKPRPTALVPAAGTIGTDGGSDSNAKDW